MSKAIFTSNNLIGDALWISLGWRQWYEEHPGWEIELVTLNDHVQKVYMGMGVPVKAVHYERLGYLQSGYAQYDLEHAFDVNKAFLLSDQKRQHVGESYADLLGVQLDRKPDKSHLVPYYRPPVGTDLSVADSMYYANSILVSMFSASCSSRGVPPGPPNKMLPWHKWKPILKAIAKQFPHTPIWFLGSPVGDVVPSEFFNIIPGGGYAVGIPLDKLAHIMRGCKFLVTVDNGMSHLAASQLVREFIFYPKALGEHYILPHGNPNMRYVHMDPNTLTPAQAVWELQEAWKAWGLV